MASGCCLSPDSAPSTENPETELIFTSSTGESTTLGVNEHELILGGRSFIRTLEADGSMILREIGGARQEIRINLENLPQSIEIGGNKYQIEARKRNLADSSNKIKRLDEIIEEERQKNGKVVVLVDFVEAVDRLVARYNERYGAGSAVGISNAVPVRSRQNNIWRFRSETSPSVLIGTTETLGSSLNLFQIPGSPFHISTLVRLSRPWWNVDDAERLVGIGQDHQVKVITLVSRFRQETMNQRGPLRTIEERVEDKLAEKREIFSHVVDGKPIVDEQARQQLEALAAEAVEGKKASTKEEEKTESAPETVTLTESLGSEEPMIAEEEFVLRWIEKRTQENPFKKVRVTPRVAQGLTVTLEEMEGVLRKQGFREVAGEPGYWQREGMPGDNIGVRLSKTNGQAVNNGGDQALLGKNPGGIDMNPNKLNLQTQGQGVEFNLPFDPNRLDQIPINGLTPVIFEITPVTNLPLLLDLADDESKQLSAVR